MSRHHQLIGIIEIDADHRLFASADDTIEDTLHRLRCDQATLSLESEFPDIEDWCSAETYTIESMHLLQADLRRLRSDLESALAQLLDQLFSIS